jgi:hypothetical protein
LSDEEQKKKGFIVKHPFAGFIGNAVSLISNLTYLKNDKIEKFWLDDKRGWPILGLIMAHTKLDIDNPTLREWCMLFIRHITSWSEAVRERLKTLTLMDKDGAPITDLESAKSFQALGKPMQDMYKKEMEKYK